MNAALLSTGQRVRHLTWTDDSKEPLVGTVHLLPDPKSDSPGGEVRWDGYLAANQLELVVDQLEPE